MYPQEKEGLRQLRLLFGKLPLFGGLPQRPRRQLIAPPGLVRGSENRQGILSRRGPAVIPRKT